MILRKSEIKDVDFLSELVYYSEKSLGFDENYMSVFKDKYNVNKDFIEDSISYCMLDNDIIVGFFGLKKVEVSYELEFFYISSNYKGMGLGRLMFQYMIEKCKELNISEFDLVTSPESMNFYTKLGAIKTGEKVSLIDSKRIIPKLKYIVK